MGKSSDSSVSESEEDRRQRDEFSERLKKRDKEKTRNITSRSGKSYHIYDKQGYPFYISGSVNSRPRLYLLELKNCIFINNFLYLLTPGLAVRNI